MRIVTTLAVIMILIPLAARGQTTARPLFRADTTASIGWFTADHGEGENCCAEWSSSLFKGVGGGYYWTDHLKSEAEIGWPGPTHAFTYPTARPFADGSPLIYEEHTYHGTKVSASQLYQFGRNAMFHPFAGVGVDVDRDRDEIVRTIQAGRAFSQISLTEHEVHARPFVTTGFKAYFSERAFFRSELKVAFSHRLDQVVWKSGLGVDLGKSSARPLDSSRSGPAKPAATSDPRDRQHRRADDPEVWRAYARKLPIGSTLKIATDRDRLVASLLAVDDTGILVKPKTRVPEPARHLSFDALDEVELYTDGTTADRAGAIVAGVGSGAGTFFL